MPIQLVWKTEHERCSVGGITTRVGSIWISQLRNSEQELCNSDTRKTVGVGSNWISIVDLTSVTASSNANKISRKKKTSLSRVHGNARRLQAFLEHKQSPTLDSLVAQKELDSTNSASQDKNVFQERNNVDQDEDLKSFLDKKVSSVNFFNKGDTSLTLPEFW